MLIYIVKYLKILDLEKLTRKCKKDKYEELVGVDLMHRCSNGELLQNCAGTSQCYCLIRTFLISCQKITIFYASVKKWGHYSQKEPFCDFCQLDRDMIMFSSDCFALNKSSDVPKILHNFILFYRIISYRNDVNRRVVDEYFNCWI